VRYETFSIKFDPRDGDGCYRVTVDAPAGQVAGLFQVSAIVRKAIDRVDLFTSPNYGVGAARDLARAASGGIRSTPAEIGGALFQALFHGDVLNCLHESRGIVHSRDNGGLRLQIHLDLRDADVASLSELPWEFLFRKETNSFIGLDRKSSIVRFLDVGLPALSIFQPHPLRVAVIASKPNEVTALNLKLEEELIKSAWEGKEGVELVFLDSIRQDTLRQALLERDFHVLHFMGHGEFSERTGQGYLVLEDRLKKSRLINGESLSHLLRGLPELRLVVLNACETAATTMEAKHDPFGGVAQALVRGGLPAVVAMSHPISDRAAISFSANLYRRLAAGDPLDAAVVEGRLAVYAESLDSPEWGIPAVFLRVPNATLFEGGPNSQARALYDRGLMSFKRKDFRLAREHFRNVLALRPDYEDAELYLCLSTLSMNAPTMLTLFAADQLNEQLDRLTRSSRKRVADLSRLALAVLRLDYYEQKRIKAKGTPTDELFRTLQDGQPSREQREALAAVARSRRAALRFRLDH